MGGPIREDAVNGDGQATGSNSTRLPVALIFGTMESPDKQLITAHLLGKLPQETMDKLFAVGQSIGSDDVKVHRLGGTAWFNSLVRLQQYLDHGSYYPFNPASPMFVLDSADKMHKWVGQSTSVPDGDIRTLEATHNLFLKEIELYRFAYKFKHDELREYSSTKLRTAYPVFAKEVLALLDQLYRIAVDIKDQAMVDFIKSAFEKHADGVVKEPLFLPVLRSTVKRDPLGSILLDRYISSASLAEADHLLAQIPAAPAARTEEIAPPAVKQKEKGPVEHMTWLLDAIKNERLAVAVQSGYGTLLGQGTGYTRNRNFKFVRFELFLVDYSRPANGRLNTTVINSRGEKGDILATLVRIVPPGLGAADEVNGGVDAPTAPMPDRESRVFSTSKTSRSRSRSPVRVKAEANHLP